MMMDVTAPGILKANGVVSGIVSWENWVNVLHKAWGQHTTISPIFRTALLMGTLPKDYQENALCKIGIHTATAVEDVPAYEAAKDMAVRVFNHKHEMSTPTAMDIIEMEGGEEGECDAEAVGNVKCYK